jgi:uncharacterized protein
MEIIGFIAAIFIGITLGLIGAGGSILTVPVLVYLFQTEVVTATSYSLFIVGITSLVGSYQFFKSKLINVKVAVVFGIPSIIAVYFTRAIIVPAIPLTLFSIGNTVITKDMMLMILFAVLMIAASYSMIKRKKESELNQPTKLIFNYPMILLEGLIVGILTGLVGAGGGFLIIPALVMLSKLQIKEAIATSLVIIAAKSLIGFTGESNLWSLDWQFLLTISAFSIFGMFFGILLNKKIDGKKLKPAFGWFVLIMGILIIFKEIF